MPGGTNFLEFSRKPGWHSESFEIDTAPGQLAARIIPESLPTKILNTLEIDLGCTGLSPEAAWFEGRASGLDGVQLFHNPITPWTFPTMLEFSGRENAFSREGCAVQVNTRNYGGELGIISLLDCHRPIYPLTFSDPGFSSWSLSDWWDQCHRKRGLVIWADEQTRNNPHGHGEALAGILLGKVDALECTDFDSSRDGGISLWMDLLALGLAPSLAGSSGHRSPHAYPGKMRSLINSQDSNWVNAVADGKVIATLGPSIEVRLNDSHPGQTIRFSGERLTLDANWDPPGCQDAPMPLMIEALGGQGLFWKSVGGNGSGMRADIPIPPDTGPQITVRMTGANGRILAQSSPFMISNRQPLRTEHTMCSMNRLLARLDETAKQLSGNLIHFDRREQVEANLNAARIKLVSTFSQDFAMERCLP